MYTYIIVFQYTKNCHLYIFNKTVELDKPFCVDDKEAQEKIATEENGHKCWIENIVAIEPSRKPPKKK